MCCIIHDLASAFSQMYIIFHEYFGPSERGELRSSKIFSTIIANFNIVGIISRYEQSSFGTLVFFVIQEAILILTANCIAALLIWLARLYVYFDYFF
ncbi:hypothetical protein PFISCL1PPCAC_14116 [Pristionchus fissidentatus]|uniref:Uncharacterized protein n=1 Tax=Pristionchus fissidentatus TaxID=1538716 RepID=A0AAV5VTC5_9BILA|nr:hypothetical protein PFISCL1PPCAC_14116 [Pristionchus fissidentatus]